MATSTIPQLTQAISLTGAEQLEAVQSGASVRVTASQIAGVAPSGLAATASYTDDGAAAAGGVAIGQFYRNGSNVQVRVT